MRLSCYAHTSAPKRATNRTHSETMSQVDDVTFLSGAEWGLRAGCGAETPKARMKVLVPALPPIGYVSLGTVPQLSGPQFPQAARAPALLPSGPNTAVSDRRSPICLLSSMLREPGKRHPQNAAPPGPKAFSLFRTTFLQTQIMSTPAAPAPAQQPGLPSWEFLADGGGAWRPRSLQL